jgi:hypothetical protein
VYVFVYECVGAIFIDLLLNIFFFNFRFRYSCVYIMSNNLTTTITTTNNDTSCTSPSYYQLKSIQLPTSSIECRSGMNVQS